MKTGRVELLYRGEKSGVIKQKCELLELRLDGIVGDRHAGALKKADGRDKGIPRGTMIRNWRQWSAVSTEELNEVALALALGELEPELLGPNFVVAGIENFSAMAKGTVLKFSDAELLVEAENDPCTQAGKAIAKRHEEISPHAFVKKAMHKRGLVGVVKAAGIIRVGESFLIVDP
jgi:MOSC domain-containing protein YiiM